MIVRKLTSRYRLLPVWLLTVLLVLPLGCGTQESPEELPAKYEPPRKLGAASIRVPGPFEIAIVDFKKSDGTVFARIAPYEDDVNFYTREDESQVHFLFEDDRMTAQTPEGEVLFELIQDGNLIQVVPEAEAEPTWHLKFVKDGIEFSKPDESPELTLLKQSSSPESLTGSIQIKDAEDNVVAVAVFEENVAMLKDKDGEILCKAEAFVGVLPIACFALEGISVDAQVALAVFLATP